MLEIQTRRLRPADRSLARVLFDVLAYVFDEQNGPLTDEYLDALLRQESFWAIVAMVDEQVVGGITAHALPMTRSMTSELFIYDLAVREDSRRQGVASRLVRELCAAAGSAGISEVFVPADNDDAHALEFYRELGGEESPVTFFAFNPADIA